LRLVFLRVEGRAIAFRLGLEHNGSYYSLKAGFDPAYRRFSPGIVQTHLMIKRAFENGLSRYDMGGRDEAYKLRWASDHRRLVLLQAFARSPVGRMEWAAWAHGRPLAKRLLATYARRPRPSNRQRAA
jgi:CelD/BcsL family acetyltransferase involved in cellulose biosynthesis